MAKTKSRSKTKSKSRSKSKPGDEYMWYIGIAVVLLLIGVYFCNNSKYEQFISEKEDDDKSDGDNKLLKKVLVGLLIFLLIVGAIWVGERVQAWRAERLLKKQKAGVYGFFGRQGPS